MTRILLASLTLVALAACGGKSGTLSLSIKVSPGDDPFNDADINLFRFESAALLDM